MVITSAASTQPTDILGTGENVLSLQVGPGVGEGLKEELACLDGF